MSTPSLGLYVAASLALIATPGQDMIYVITRSLAQGRFAGVCSAVGVCIGILVHTALAALGVGAILHASETLFVALKLAGAAYLIYLGVKLLATRAGREGIAAPKDRLSPGALVRQGILSNVTNPKIVLFFFAFLPQFVDPASAHATRDLALLGVLYALLALPVKAAVGIAAGSLSERVLRNPSMIAWMNRVSGGVLVALGLRLAMSERV
ncbi:MAG TPA: LysE family translocator [Usitatibacter sp.]|nr:LysE family translocator [Usitatibacter sp.]